MAYPIARKILSKYLLGRITKAEGIENIPDDRGILFVSNHVGWHDPLLTVFYLVSQTGFHKVYSLTEWGMFEKPVLGKWMGAIPVMKDKAWALETGSRYLRDEKNILIYPQARVDNSPTISDVKTGAARLALMSKCPVIPIGLTRMNPVETTEWRKYKEIFTGKISIRIGRPVDLSSWYGKEFTRELLYEVMDAIMEPVAVLADKRYIKKQ